MEARTHSESRKALDKARRTQPRDIEGFDVTVQMKIGEVRFDALGSMSILEAAFHVIANHIQTHTIEEGVFQFPAGDGRTNVVNWQTLDTAA